MIAHNLGAMPELVSDEVNGFLVGEDPVEWVNAVRRMEAPGVGARLGDGAFTAWRARHSPSEGLRALEAAYTELSVPSTV